MALFGPLGRAIFTPDLAQPILCIAGGSGIAGMMSILARACAERHFDRYRGHVYFGVRTARDLFFVDELAAFKAQFPDGLEVTLALSDEGGAGSVADALGVLVGHGLHPRGGGPRHAGTVQLASGPTSPARRPWSMGSLRMLLREARLSPSDIRYDKFS